VYFKREPERERTMIHSDPYPRNGPMELGSIFIAGYIIRQAVAREGVGVLSPAVRSFCTDGFLAGEDPNSCGVLRSGLNKDTVAPEIAALWQRLQPSTRLAFLTGQARDGLSYFVTCMRLLDSERSTPDEVADAIDDAIDRVAQYLQGSSDGP
jgi:hypothetical protein